jgi:hypothetical protein
MDVQGAVVTETERKADGELILTLRTTGGDTVLLGSRRYLRYSGSGNDIKILESVDGRSITDLGTNKMTKSDLILHLENMPDSAEVQFLGWTDGPEFLPVTRVELDGEKIRLFCL